MNYFKFCDSVRTIIRNPHFTRMHIYDQSCSRDTPSRTEWTTVSRKITYLLSHCDSSPEWMTLPAGQWGDGRDLQRSPAVAIGRASIAKTHIELGGVFRLEHQCIWRSRKFPLCVPLGGVHSRYAFVYVVGVDLCSNCPDANSLLEEIRKLEEKVRLRLFFLEFLGIDIGLIRGGFWMDGVLCIFESISFDIYIIMIYCGLWT